MTIENEETKKVSNEELLVDIANTEKEVEAYDKLSVGFYTLAHLPENTERMYFFESQKYERLSKECTRFLETLLELKAERGIQ
jgi:hypothetical protein